MAGRRWQSSLACGCSRDKVALSPRDSAFTSQLTPPSSLRLARNQPATRRGQLLTLLFWKPSDCGEPGICVATAAKPWRCSPVGIGPTATATPSGFWQNWPPLERMLPSPKRSRAGPPLCGRQDAQGREKPVRVFYVDGHRKPVYADALIPRGLIGRTGKILGCRALVVLHDQEGHPARNHPSRRPASDDWTSSHAQRL